MIVFASRTGNVRAVVEKLGVEAIALTETLQVTSPFILFTYTDALGAVPSVVATFMARNAHHCIGILASGNRNFGHAYFARAGDTLAAQYDVPLLKKIELRGTQADLTHMKALYNDYMKVGRTL